MTVKVEVIRKNSEIRTVLDCRTSAEIGTGGFGSVRTCGPSVSRFAVKTFKPGHNSSASAECLALQEAEMNDMVIRCLGKNTRNITLILPADGEANSTTVYRYPRGKNRYLLYGTCRQRRPIDLRDLLDDKIHLSDANVLWLATDIARKVASLHDCGLFHSDIKTENILACIRGRDGDAYVRVIDFGMATKANKVRLDPGGSVKRMTSKLEKLFEEVLGMNNFSRIYALQISREGILFISDSAARDRFAYAVLACELVKGRVGKAHDFCEALRNLLDDLIRGDLREVARSVSCNDTTARKFSGARAR
jgi:serine/threonine protein kinase